MKLALRTAILMLVVVGTYVAAAVQQVAAFDGGPILVCPPNNPQLLDEPATPLNGPQSVSTRSPK